MTIPGATLNVLFINTILGYALLAIFFLVLWWGAFYGFVGLSTSHRAGAAWDGLVKGHHVPIWIRGMRWDDLPLFHGSAAIIALHAIGSEASPSADALLAALRDSCGELMAADKEDEVDRCASFSGIFPDIMQELLKERFGDKLIEQVLALDGDSGAKAT